MKAILPCCMGVFMLLSCKAQQAKEECEILYAIEGKECAYPRLSADGKQVLLQSNKAGNWQLYVLDITAKETKVVFAPTKHNDNFPDWSADNEWVAFVSDRDGNEEIYIARTNGNELKRITNDAERDIHPYFSPDGKYLLFNSTRGNGSLDIYRYTIATGETEQITNTPNDHETCARYSPDMQQIVFLKNNDVSDDLYVMDMGKKLYSNITNTPMTTDGWPMFDKTGKWIYYSSMESGTYCIYRIQPDGKNKKRLTRAAQGEEDARVYVAADGKSFIYNKRKKGTLDVRVCLLVD